MNFCPFPHENLFVPPELSLVENFEQPYTTFHNGFTQLRGEDHCYSQNPQTYTDPGDGICKPSIILALYEVQFYQNYQSWLLEKRKIPFSSHQW